MDKQAFSVVASAIHKSYLHQRRGDNHCAICGNAKEPLAFHVLEKTYKQGDDISSEFVLMSEYNNRLSGVFPVCIRCSPACHKCGLPIPTERVTEFGISVNAHEGCGVCEHMHFNLFIEAIKKRLFGQGRFKDRG